MEPRAESPQSSRERVLETARRLFHEQGYNATGIATILREAGVNSGSLYHFFPSKEHLLEGVLETYLRLLHPVVMGPAIAAEPDPIERVFRLLANYREGYTQLSFRMGCPIGNLALEVADDRPRARELIHQNFQNWMATVEGWLAEAGDRLPPRTDRRELAVMVLTVMEGGLMQARAAQSPGPFDASVSRLRDYFGLLQQAAAGAKRGGDPNGGGGRSG